MQNQCRVVTGMYEVIDEFYRVFNIADDAYEVCDKVSDMTEHMSDQMRKALFAELAGGKTKSKALQNEDGAAIIGEKIA